MHSVRRAAVTGLLAAWLAPLPAAPQGCDRDCRCTAPCLAAEAPDRVAAERQDAIRES